MRYIQAFAFLTVLLLATTSGVQATSGGTRVRGNVYDQINGVPINNLTIQVSCNGITKTDNTNSSGLYVVDFTKAECDKYAPVSATGTFKDETQGKNVLVSAQNTATMDLDFGLVSVPEFGMIGGAVAAIGSGLAWLGMKKRFSQ